MKKQKKFTSFLIVSTLMVLLVIGGVMAEPITRKVISDNSGVSTPIVYEEDEIVSSETESGTIGGGSGVSYPMPVKEFFNGKGFIKSEDGSQAYLADFQIFENHGKILGKAVIDNQLYKLRGEIIGIAVDGTDFGYNGYAVEFNLFSYKSSPYVLEESYTDFDLDIPGTLSLDGKFKGTLISYRSLSILEGNLDNFKGKDWRAYIYSKQTITIPSFIKGDVNADGNVNMKDVYYLIKYIFEGGKAPMPLESGDFNEDGKVNISDVVALIKYIQEKPKPLPMPSEPVIVEDIA